MNNILLVPSLAAAAIAASAYFPGEKVEGPSHVDRRVPKITLLASDRIDFETPLDGAVTLVLYDIRGVIIPIDGVAEHSEMPVGGRGSFRFSLNGTSSGMYFVVLRNEAGVSARGVVHLR